MNRQFEFADIDDTGWRVGWTVLGSERCEPLLAMLGVPSGMAASPAFLRDLSQGAWETYYFVLPYLPDVLPEEFADEEAFQRADEAWESTVRSLLERMYARLAEHYGDGEAAALYAWIQRHFVDLTRQKWWYDWCATLMHLTSGWRQPYVPLPLPAQKCRWLTTRVRAELDESKIAVAVERIARALAQGPSPFDRRVAQQYELTTGGDQVGFSIAATLEVILSRERARALWAEFKGRLTPAELQALLDWGRREAAASNRKLGEAPPPEVD